MIYLRSITFLQLTHSTLESIFSGLARSTTKIRIGIKASADVPAPFVCRNRPMISRGIPPILTEYDFTTIQDANHLVSWRFIVIDLKQLCYQQSFILSYSPCSANPKKPWLASPSGTSRCFSLTQPNNLTLCENTASRSKSSVMTGCEGTS